MGGYLHLRIRFFSFEYWVEGGGNSTIMILIWSFKNRGFCPGIISWDVLNDILEMNLRMFAISFEKIFLVFPGPWPQGTSGVLPSPHGIQRNPLCIFCKILEINHVFWIPQWFLGIIPSSSKGTNEWKSKKKVGGSSGPKTPLELDPWMGGCENCLLVLSLLTDIYRWTGLYAFHGNYSWMTQNLPRRASRAAGRGIKGMQKDNP